MIVMRLSRPSPNRAPLPSIKIVVSLGRSRRFTMKNQIIPYFQIELDDNMQMNSLQNKPVAMMEDLKHYHYHSLVFHSPFKIQSAKQKQSSPNVMD